MSGFLKQVAEQLYGKYSDKVSELVILLPSQRARLFFCEALSEIVEHPIWSPHFVTVDELMSNISTLHSADRLRLISELYNVYPVEQREDFDRFYSWGEMLVADFDMVDKYRVDADKLFINIADIKECHFLDLSGADTRRAIAESLVKNIPYGACVMAYHESTERNIVARLANYCPDLANHLLSFTYRDPLKLFESGSYYVKAMGNSFSLKSVAPALYPNDKDMDYHNLEGKVKNGTQAMAVIEKARSALPEEVEEIKRDLIAYCDLDAYAIAKILKKLYEVV